MYNWQLLAFTVAVLEYCTLLLAVTVIGSDTYVIYDPIFTVHIHTYNKRHTSVKSFIYDKPRGASPLGQFLLVGPLFLCVEKVS